MRCCVDRGGWLLCDGFAVGTATTGASEKARMMVLFLWLIFFVIAFVIVVAVFVKQSVDRLDC